MPKGEHPDRVSRKTIMDDNGSCHIVLILDPNLNNPQSIFQMDYNQGTMHRKFFYITLLIIILFTQSFSDWGACLLPGPYELIDTVNSYRISMGLYALNPESHVMAAAQSHADWIVSTGNGGHTGASGSDETMRAILGWIWRWKIHQM